MTSNVAPTILHRKTPTPLRSERKVHLPACDRLLLIPFPRSKARKHPKKTWNFKTLQKEAYDFRSESCQNRSINILSMAIWFAVRGEQNLRCALRFDCGAWFRAFRNLPAKKNRSLFFAGTPPELWNHFQNLIQNSAKPGPCPKLTKELPTSRWMRPQRGAHFGSFLSLLLFFLSFSGKLFRNGCILYWYVFFDVCSKCVKVVPFRKQKPAKRQKFYISRRDRYAVSYDWHLSQIESKPAIWTTNHCLKSLGESLETSNKINYRLTSPKTNGRIPKIMVWKRWTLLKTSPFFGIYVRFPGCNPQKIPPPFPLPV